MCRGNLTGGRIVKVVDFQPFQGGSFIVTARLNREEASSSLLDLTRRKGKFTGIYVDRCLDMLTLEMSTGGINPCIWC
jgi:hypothetical protein